MHSSTHCIVCVLHDEHLFFFLRFKKIVCVFPARFEPMILRNQELVHTISLIVVIYKNKNLYCVFLTFCETIVKLCT